MIVKLASSKLVGDNIDLVVSESIMVPTWEPMYCIQERCQQQLKELLWVPSIAVSLNSFGRYGFFFCGQVYPPGYSESI